MDALSLRVRDRTLVRIAVQQEYGAVRVAAVLPPREVVEVVVAALWEPRGDFTGRQAFGGILKAVKRLMDLLRRAPRALDAMKEALGFSANKSLTDLVRSGELADKLKELVSAGKKALGKAFRSMAQTFPLSLFFVPKNKAPSLTDLITRILARSPTLSKVLSKVKGGIERFDQLLKKYVPNLSRAVYAAVFAYVWLNVAELSWDVQGIIKGFLGHISLTELLASMPESGVGLLAASFGLGYGALPYAILARLVWLVVNHYVSWEPGRGLRVHWSKMGVPERDEMVAMVAMA